MLPFFSTEFFGMQPPYVDVFSNFWFLHNTADDQRLVFEEHINKNFSRPYYETILDLINQDDSLLEKRPNRAKRIARTFSYIRKLLAKMDKDLKEDEPEG